ncbi:MAG TPA: hypothetical protein VIY29_18735 [Ktedonobacteraceae bacterium]
MKFILMRTLLALAPVKQPNGIAGDVVCTNGEGSLRLDRSVDNSRNPTTMRNISTEAIPAS